MKGGRCGQHCCCCWCCSSLLLLPFIDAGEREDLHYPTTKQWHAKMEAQSEFVRTRYRTFGADLYAQSVLINKISGSELSRKFTKSALLVG